MKVNRSEIDINAPADRVWEILCDLGRYGEWNGFTPRISATEIVVGQEFDLDCQMSDKKLLRDEHEVFLAFEPANRKVCWGTSRKRGRPGIKSFRWQICEEVDATHTHFINFEEFHGILAPLVQFLYGKKLKVAFEKYCRALKQRAEA